MIASSAMPEREPRAGDSPEFSDLPSARAEIERLRGAASIADAREKELVEELQHRVRNMLAAIRSIYRQSLALSRNRDEFAQHLQGRLDAIARNQDYAGVVRAAAIEIEDIVRGELLSAHVMDGPRCTIAGPPVRVEAKRAELIGLAIHELTTNAVKFGAIGQNGRLSVTWSIDAAGFHLRWCEDLIAVAAVAPRPSGFGRQLIEEALPYQLGATTSLQLKPGGVLCTIDLPHDAKGEGSDVPALLLLEHETDHPLCASRDFTRKTPPFCRNASQA